MASQLFQRLISRGGRNAALLVVAFSVLCAGAVLANLAFQVMQGRADTIAHASENAAVLVRVLEAQTISSVDATELALLAVDNVLRVLPPSQPSRQNEVARLLAESIDRLPFIRAIWVLDANGDMIHDSEHLPGRYNLSERAYFKIHRDDKKRGLYIDQPIVSKHGVPFIGLSRRIDRPDGSFGGVVVAALEPDHLRRFYQTIRTGRDGAVALIRRDGALLLRVPDLPIDRSRPAPRLHLESEKALEGSYRTVSVFDDVERLYFFRHVARRPLVVVVGLSEREMLADWRRTSLAYALVSLAFLLLIATLAWLALRELNRRRHLDRALGESESALRAAQRLSATGSWTMELDTQRGHWSEEMYRLFHRPAGGEVPPLADFLQMIHPDDRFALLEAGTHGVPYNGVMRTNPDAGAVRYLQARSSLVTGSDGKPAGLMGTLQDVTEQRRADEKLRLAARVFDQTGDGIIVTDGANRIVAVNAAFERITGYAESEALRRAPNFLHEGAQDDAFLGAVWRTVQAEGQWRGEIRSRRKNGEVYPSWLVLSAISDGAGQVDGYVGVFTDLSGIRHATAQLQFMHNHDPLTSLPNRSLLNDRLLQAIDAVRPQQRKVAVLLLNVDRLKRINEGIGHDAGDLLLREVGLRLGARLQPGDTLARLGSDEFVMLLTDSGDGGDVNACARQMLDAVAQPFRLDGHELTVTASIGIAMYPDDGATPGALIKNADTALSHAKESGRNSFRYFTAQMNVHALHWMSLEHRLRGALARDELLLYYQPQMSAAGERMVGAEALIRWQNGDAELVSPAEFIPLAEETLLILPIGEWVIHSACRQVRTWLDAGLAPVRIAVNVSAHQITAGDVATVVRAALDANDVGPQWLTVELTESVLMKEAELAALQIAQLREMGVLVALDDFGTGYSSLAYLSRFALDKIKIDQSLVRDVTTDAKSAAIASATIALAHGLGLTVVAEGVETQEQLAFLRGAACDEIQGYLFSRPVPAARMGELLVQEMHVDG